MTEDKLREKCLYSEGLMTQVGELKVELNSAYLSKKGISTQINTLKEMVENENTQSKKQSLYLNELKDYFGSVLHIIRNFISHFDSELVDCMKLKAFANKLIEVKETRDFVDALKSITEFIKLLIEEMKSLIKLKTSQETSIQTMVHKIAETEKKCENLQAIQAELKERERYLNEEINILKQKSYRPIVHNEPKEIQTIVYKTARTPLLITNTQDERLKEENKELEELLIKYCDYFPSKEMRGIALSVVKNLLEIHSFGKERYELLNELEKIEGNLKLKPEASVDPMITFKLRKEAEELKRIIVQYDNFINKNKRQIRELEYRLQQKSKLSEMSINKDDLNKENDMRIHNASTIKLN